MTATARESAKLVTNDPENKNLAKAAELLNESITLIGKDIESIQARLDAQQQKTDVTKATLVGTQQELDQLKLLPESIQAEVNERAALVNSATATYQTKMAKKKNFSVKVADQKAIADDTSSQYFALLPK